MMTVREFLYNYSYIQTDNMFICFVATIIIGFEDTKYIVDETSGTHEVYVRLFNYPDDQPFLVTIDLVIQTIATSASKNLLDNNYCTLSLFFNSRWSRF